MLNVITSGQFGKDYRKCMKKHLDIGLLDKVITDISEKKVLPAKFKVHKLSGEYKNCWECHLLPDWLLIWQINEDKEELYLIRTGSHSDLFK